MHTVSDCDCFVIGHKDKMVYLPPHTHLGKQTYFCWNALKMVPEVGMPLKDFPLDRIRFV